ncbi:hypothetical protein EV127DRAFT_481643 [Xylaria flabelliformis]|nr:hypothetical protein EV127DRAFT_481643 [Xylaria flabelliformis]
MGKFGPAEQSLNDALKVRRKLGNDDDTAATLNNLGLPYNSIHKFDLAEKQYSEALQIHLSKPESVDRNLSLTMVKHNLQRNAIQSGRNIPPLSELQETVDFFEASTSWWMKGHAYLVLGNFFLELKKYDDASAAYSTAIIHLAMRVERASNPQLRWFTTSWVMLHIRNLNFLKLRKFCVYFFKSKHHSRLAHQCTNCHSAIFRKSIAISELYPAIPAEQARTQFMLAKALHLTGQSKAAEEAEKKVAALMKDYCMSIGTQGVIVCSEVGDFSKFITAKYQ